MEKYMRRFIHKLLIVALLPAMSISDPLPLPCDEIWRLDLNSDGIVVGPVWNEDGAINMLLGIDRQLIKVSNGRIAALSDTLDGRITAIERADADETEGVETLAGILNDSLNSLLILEEGQFEIINDIQLGEIWTRYDNPEDTIRYERESWYEKTTCLKWLDVDSTLLVVRHTSTIIVEEFISGGEINGVTWKMDIAGNLIGDSIICGDPAIKQWQDIESGESGFVVIGTQIEWWNGDLASGEITTFLGSNFNNLGELLNQQQITSFRSYWSMFQRHPTMFLTSIAAVPLPGGGVGAFESIVLDSTNWEWDRELQCSLYVQLIDDQLESLGVYFLGNRPVESMFYLPADMTAEGRPYLLCAGADGSIRLFDLENFVLNEQEYRWQPGSDRLLGGDFDGDGRMELIGLHDGVLTCARIQTLDSPGMREIPILLKLHLSPAFPNPFNSKTTITYTLPTQTPVILQIYNTRGQLVDVLVDRVMAAGQHNVLLNGADLSNGVYFVNLGNNTHQFTQKLLHVR